MPGMGRGRSSSLYPDMEVPLLYRWGAVCGFLVLVTVALHSYVVHYVPRYMGLRDMQTQSSAVTCGPAALVYVLHKRGIEVTEESVSSMAGTQASGTTMLGLAQAVEHVGLRARGLRGGYDVLLQVPLPVIAVFNQHYVVITRVNSKEVEVGDPLYGFFTYPRRAFQRIWQGQILVIEG
jgi:ABC-type bacteriocin/lantibiotic exporter with double-glycine peptidase domain